MKVWVSESHPFYQVWVDGKIYDSFEANRAVERKYNYPLTHSQLIDIANSYREALNDFTT